MSEARKRIPELDGLRVLMIFIVSWYHIWQQSWLRPMIGSYSLDYLVRSGYIWVDGTVLLSAFLLFLPYAKAMRERAPRRTRGISISAGRGGSCRGITSSSWRCSSSSRCRGSCMTANRTWSRTWRPT